MSLSWIQCPACGSVEALRRLGEVGVPPSRYGKRVHIKDSKSVKCLACGTVFRSSGPTMFEAMGRDPREEVPF